MKGIIQFNNEAKQEATYDKATWDAKTEAEKTAILSEYDEVYITE